MTRISAAANIALHWFNCALGTGRKYELLNEYRGEKRDTYFRKTILTSSQLEVSAAWHTT